ncbi:MAG: DUF2061 domain-containing protein [Chloroflexi bacterium]|jgi:adenylylsulfate kinase|nr:DUF2061 domain-containing protein [Chloroflexota bacterium]MBT7082002.1 DUF2061 domain-containing protein [Chloroflexota bacterium]MBT7290728.1 DUF2061 domain-containing protein [Chloroflexota bacterium]
METHKRSIVKALTWRVLAYAITAFVAYLFTGKLALALEIGFADTLIKLFVYYAHERTWMKTKYGMKKEVPEDYAI